MRTSVLQNAEFIAEASSAIDCTKTDVERFVGLLRLSDKLTFAGLSRELADLLVYRIGDAAPDELQTIYSEYLEVVVGARFASRRSQ